MPVSTLAADTAAVAERLRSDERFILTTHENPDGDALGSMLGMQRLLTLFGKDSVMFLAAKEFPLAVEYQFLPLEEVFHEAPADIADRTVIFLDCGNVDRMPVEFLQTDGAVVLNIDHHHDNTRFGEVNLVDPDACCTAQIVWRLAHELGVEIDREMAEALYVGLVTDTGKFMYENTDEESHRMATEMLQCGVRPSEVYRRLYEHAPIEKLLLLARALSSIERTDDGEIATAYVSNTDYEETGASETLTEGIIDSLRTLDGTRLVAVVRDRSSGEGTARKVSLRGTDPEVDVSAIARSQGGGGHPRAAGFSTDLGYQEILEVLRNELPSAK